MGTDSLQSRGRSRVTLRDVAEAAGVSVQTVSNVVNGRADRMAPKTLSRIEDVIDELGYHPNNAARGLRSSRTMTVAFIVLDAHSAFLADPLTDLLIAGVGDVALERGYGVLIQGARPGAHNRNLLAPLHEARVDGAFVLLSGEPKARQAILAELQATGKPFVLFDEHPPSESVLSVRADQYAGAARLVEYLIGRGHRRIGFIAAKVPWPVVEDRLAGYRDALAKAGIGEDVTLQRFEGKYQPDGGHHMMQELIDLADPPTAVLCGSDLLAIGAISSARRRGLHVPDDIAICGFNDFTVAEYFDPPLTTVRVPGYEMGRAGANLLLDRLDGRPHAHEQIVFPVELRVRGSA
ncbi:LacI family DNA-binding transcriptional regulator [Mycobacterium sp. DSM 3803]|nr:LacI family DNA-binding transcriptional regulator [Mycobacterium sp. DSM 3803]